MCPSILVPIPLGILSFDITMDIIRTYVRFQSYRALLCIGLPLPLRRLLLCDGQTLARVCRLVRTSSHLRRCLHQRLEQRSGCGQEARSFAPDAGTKAAGDDSSQREAYAVRPGVAKNAPTLVFRLADRWRARSTGCTRPASSTWPRARPIPKEIDRPSRWSIDWTSMSRIRLF